MKEKVYVAIDLKSFYASVECIERNLDPLTTNLVVADSSRTQKTICLAVSPSLKSFGISGRPRLFEVVEKVKDINRKRYENIHFKNFKGQSFNYNELRDNPFLSLNFITAMPRMSLYIKYSAEIYNIYLKYIAAEDIHVYSIDEVFIDLTNYLETYHLSPEELTMKIILDVFNSTGITATAGIGPNLYLAKIAMDIRAKHIPADKNGVRIAVLDELSYRKLLWNHKPLTDFWRVGKGYAKKLEEKGLYTMGDIARCSLGKTNDFYNEDLLYKMFGVNAELLIDHAWGWEPCTIKDIKSYKPSTNSIVSGQVLHKAYSYEQTKLVIKEMADSLSLNLIEKTLVTNQIVMTIGYDEINSKNDISKNIQITTDLYGRKIPKSAHGTINFEHYTSSLMIITEHCLKLFDEIINPNLFIKRISISANHVINEKNSKKIENSQQLSLFDNIDTIQKEKESEKVYLEKERKLQNTIIDIKKKYGKNAILKGMNYIDGATMIDRNQQIGGHKA